MPAVPALAIVIGALGAARAALTRRAFRFRALAARALMCRCLDQQIERTG